MKFINYVDYRATAIAYSYATEYPAEQCEPGNANELKCCQYKTYFWEHYNPERSCCGPDGVLGIGTC